ncbi:hypothetical protein HOP50_13g70200 [Chloropicon primus]|nr:hypothetical protein HOP50_13g70200 [Chloropicon primus]
MSENENEEEYGEEFEDEEEEVKEEETPAAQEAEEEVKEEAPAPEPEAQAPEAAAAEEEEEGGEGAPPPAQAEEASPSPVKPSNAGIKSVPAKVTGERGPEDKLEETFAKHADGGVVQKDKIQAILVEIGLEMPKNLEQVLENILPNTDKCTFLDLKGILSLVLQEVDPDYQASTSKKAHSRRSYLENGHITEDEAVLSFIRALEEHKKKCENEQKYLEAQQTSKRLTQLKYQEEEKRLKQIGERQGREKEEAEKAFNLEMEQFNSIWDERIAKYEENVQTQVALLKQEHNEFLKGFKDEQDARRPSRPQYSKELLNQRKIQEQLGRQGLYEKAMKLKIIVDKMEANELAATQATFDAEVALKEQQLRTTQQKEMDALLQRAGRGKHELNIARANEAERKDQRFRNVMAELMNLQKLEKVQLNHFINQQVLAGKRDVYPGSKKKGLKSLSSRLVIT